LMIFRGLKTCALHGTIFVGRQCLITLSILVFSASVGYEPIKSDFCAVRLNSGIYGS
jgi:hypothetical protein